MSIFPTHGSLNFSAPDRLELARRHDEFQAACVALLEEYNDLPDFEVETAADLEAVPGLWTKLLRARRALKALGL